MTTKQRIKLFIRYERISQSAFERACGFTHGYVSNIRVSLSQKACLSIARQFPHLNTDWLLTGRGEMISSGPITETERTRYMEIIRSKDERIISLENTVLEMQRTIDSLRQISKPS